MCQILEKKAALEADLETLLGIEDPNVSQSEKIERIKIILNHIQNYLNTCRELGVA